MNSQTNIQKILSAPLFLMINYNAFRLCAFKLAIIAPAGYYNEGIVDFSPANFVHLAKKYGTTAVIWGELFSLDYTVQPDPRKKNACTARIAVSGALKARFQGQDASYSRSLSAPRRACRLWVSLKITAQKALLITIKKKRFKG